MNITKKLIATGAILLAATLANAQAPTLPTGSITLTAKVKDIAYMDVVPNAANANNGWIWTTAVRATPKANEAKLIGQVLVETNMPQWDIKITPANGGIPKDGTTNLKGFIGTTTAQDAKIQLYACANNSYTTAPANTAATIDPCQLTTITGTANTGVKLDAFTATSGSSIKVAKSFGKTNGFTPAVMAAPITGGVTDGAKAATPDPEQATSLVLGIYAGLFGATTTSASISAADLAGSGDFEETFTFDLIANY